jgi:hypothetical protein
MSMHKRRRQTGTPAVVLQRLVMPSRVWINRCPACGQKASDWVRSQFDHRCWHEGHSWQWENVRCPSRRVQRGDCLERMVRRWPAKVRREIGEWLQGAICGHGSKMSKPAERRWKCLLAKLEAHNAAGEPQTPRDNH